MFRKQKSEHKPTENLSIISAGSVFRGECETNGNFRIDGKVQGNMSALGNVAIGQDGSVEGDISAQVIKVSGVVKGNLTATQHLILDATASVEGDMLTKLLSIEDGARFNGKVSMESKVPHPSELEKETAK